MGFFYVLHFKNYPEYVKIGFTSNMESRIATISTWGGLLDDSIFFELPDKSIAVGIEACLKKIFYKYSQEIATKLPNKAGKTEFIPVCYYDYVINFAKTYIELPAGTIINPIKVSSILSKQEEGEIFTDTALIDTTLQKVGNKLKSLRKAKKLTREKLAELAGIGPRTLEAAEEGKCKLHTLVVLLQILGYSDWISTFPMDFEGAVMNNPYNKKSEVTV